MARISLTHEPILRSQAGLLILPVSDDGSVLDPVLARCKTLYPDNYLAYRRACIDGGFKVGQCLVTKRQLEQSGLGANSTNNQPIYIANLATTDHPYHPIRKRWLVETLQSLQPELIRLIRYDGLRRIALLARPLIYAEYGQDTDNAAAQMRVPILDWQTDILPMLTEAWQDLPKVRIDMHVPKGIELT